MDQPGVPRYRQIVAELRQRIEDGELAPGDRVPSTREITRQWGVAMATASKVLTELRRAGLVHALPGVGTVVDAGNRPVLRPAGPQSSVPPAPVTAAPVAPARRKPAPDQTLALGRIVVAAVAVADAEGLAAVSMRRVAAELGVATMSLYRHVADKDDLLMRMMEASFSEWPLPATPPEGWREQLTLAARMLWGMFRRHPWLAPALSVSRPQPVAGALPYIEWVLAALEDSGLDLPTRCTVHLMVFNYIRGIAVNVEREAEEEALTGLNSDEWMDTQEAALHAMLASGRFPHLARLTVVGYDLDLDHLFEFGLERLLDGIGVLIEASR